MSLKGGKRYRRDLSILMLMIMTITGHGTPRAARGMSSGRYEEGGQQQRGTAGRGR